MPDLRDELLPPYGLMHREFQEAGVRKGPPADWRDGPGAGMPWNDWYQERVAEIAAHVWPEFRPGTGWVGASRDRIVALTQAEIAMILRFRAQAGMSDEPLFRQEDRGEWSETLLDYCPELGGRKDIVARAIKAGIDRKNGILDLQLKARFQRPRPWQAAMILGHHDSFSYLLAATAVTPSLVSGHALQGLIAGCNVHQALLQEDPAQARAVEAGIRRWMTDIGDRRVLAGVHYPTDSIASWVVAMRLAPCVFEDPAALAVIRRAIRESRLYRFIEAHLAADAGAAGVLSSAWSCALAVLSP